MRKLLTMFAAVLVLALAVTPALAQNQDIIATANRDANFSTFVDLVEAAGLTDALRGEGPLTVFAPTNDAFNNFLTSTGLTTEDLLANPELLNTILTFHVLPAQPIMDANQNGAGKAELRAAYAGQTDNVLELTMLSGEELTLQFTAEDAIILNNQRISVNAENIVASNGVIHAINGVLLPPSLRNEDGTPTFGSRSTVIDLLSEDPDSFSSFISALEETGLAETLSDTSQEFTVFAPTNVALAAAQSDLADADLTEILSLHIIPGEFTAQDLANELATRRVSILVLDTLNGGQITLQIAEDGTILLNGQGITVTDTDNQAANGVVHFSPAVILPRAGLTAAGAVERDSAFTVLEEALEVTGLTETLADTEGDFTVFAPTDDAFNNLLNRTGLTQDELFADTELLTSILSYHVLPQAQDAQTLTAAYGATDGDVLELATVQGEPLGLQVDPDGVILLGGQGTTVSVTDIGVDNGVIHAVPAVLLPPSLRDEQGRPLFGERTTVASYFADNSDFSILASLLEQQGLTETLSGDGPFTVFAPTNGAFQAAQDTLSGLTPEQTSTALQFHVIPQRLTAQDIEGLYLADADGILELETVSGEILTLQIQTDGTVVLNGQGITPFLFDVQTTNGVIHGIPGVLLPPSLQ